MVDKITAELKNAQLSRDEVKVSTLRLLLSEIKNAQIAKGNQLTDDEITNLVFKEMKKRKEAAASFRLGNREDQAAKEEAEESILKSFLPSQLTTEELTKIIQDTINELAANSLKDMGRVMGAVVSKVKARADGATVSHLVKKQLETIS